MNQRRIRPLWWMPLPGRAVGALRGVVSGPAAGAPAERVDVRMVGRTLRIARLFGWRSLDSVPRGRRDIDHVLVGPGGVLTLDTRHHPGGRVTVGRHVVLVDGERTDYAARARNEARFAADRLGAAVRQPVEVSPVLVVVGAARVRGRRTGDVAVVPRRWLVPHLIARGLAARVRLSRADQETLLAAARVPKTWQSGGEASTGPRSGPGGWAPSGSESSRRQST